MELPDEMELNLPGPIPCGPVLTCIPKAELAALKAENERLRSTSAQLTNHQRALAEAKKENERLLTQAHATHLRQEGELSRLRAKAQIADEIMAWCAKEHNVTLDSGYWRERWESITRIENQEAGDAE